MTTTSAPQPATLPDPNTEPTISVDRGSRILGLSIRATYNGCASGEIPSIRIGRSVRILTAQFLNKYQLAG